MKQSDYLKNFVEISNFMPQAVTVNLKHFII